MKLHDYSGLNSRQVRVYCRRVHACKQLNHADPELAALLLRADREAGFDLEIAHRRHVLRGLRFIRARRRSNAANLNALIASVERNARSEIRSGGNS